MGVPEVQTGACGGQFLLTPAPLRRVLLRKESDGREAARV